MIAEPDETFVVGTVNEDWAIESMAGRCLPPRQHLVAYPPHRKRDVVRVVDARGACRRRFPFWLGEGPGAHRSS